MNEDISFGILICALVLIFVGAGAYFGNERYRELMVQCLADGHKEYECVGILRHGSK